MAFEYVGLRSLRNPEIFQKILASSVDDTGLAYDFKVRGALRNVDSALDTFQHNAFFFLSEERMTAHRAILGITALAIHSISMFHIFTNGQVYFTDEKIVGLHAAAVRKNPNELVALTFGLAVAEIQAEWARSPTALVLAPSRVDLRAISPADIRDAIRVIAENRNRSLGANNGQYRQTFRHLSRLLRKLRSRRFRYRRKPV